MAIQKETFDFAKLPCIVFSGEDAADLGGPGRQFYKLLMRGVCLELGVFEMSRNNLVFSHDHSVISSWKPYLAGQLLSRSILHGGPGLHSLSKDVYYVMTNMNDDVDAGRAALSIAEDGAAEVARALMAIDGDSDEELEEFKNQKMEWLLKVKESIGLFMVGLDSVGGFLNGYVKENPKTFLTLFSDKSSQLNVQRMNSPYVIKWSEDGSNQREAEETTIFCGSSLFYR
ncbi:PREDICTED: uncharacterized protein LOC107350377 [Acropora digitifera]|uniref:uncharacterized protein LOC107350377 n=1 Tax=Acropora digitifera TaxID=70779 RepID=UPI00077A18FC|nr:PREDICTED: uncharacterized protein LOC107350377 [Acropora digitifera]